MSDNEGLIASDRVTFEVKVDSNVYSLEVCKKACYALMGYLSCIIQTSSSHNVITAKVTGDHSKSSVELKELLFDELLDYSLRESISSKTENVRNIILSNAFSNTRLVD